MTKIKQRELATSVTSTTFLVIGITGIMLYFKILNNYVKEMHEILGLAFVFVSVLHIFYNWKSMKNYFSKKLFLFSSLIVLFISLGFIANVVLAPTGKNPKAIIFNSVLNSPLNNSMAILTKDTQAANERLKKSGLKIQGSKSIQDIAKQNGVSPFKVVSIIAQ